MTPQTLGRGYGRGAVASFNINVRQSLFAETAKWREAFAAQGGDIDADLLSAVNGFHSDLEQNSIDGNVLYVLPGIGNSLDASLVPSTDRLNIGNATANNMIDADFAQTPTSNAGVKEESDFGSGGTAYFGIGTVLDIEQSIAGVNDALRAYADGSSFGHYVRIANSPVIRGATYRLAYDYYIPSGQTNVDAFRVFGEGFGHPTAFSSITNTAGYSAPGSLVADTQDTWVSATADIVPASDFFEIRLYLFAGSSHYTGANSPTDDRIYIKNVRFELLEQPAGWTGNDSSKYIDTGLDLYSDLGNGLGGAGVFVSQPPSAFSILFGAQNSSGTRLFRFVDDGNNLDLHWGGAVGGEATIVGAPNADTFYSIVSSASNSRTAYANGVSEDTSTVNVGFPSPNGSAYLLASNAEGAGAGGVTDGTIHSFIGFTGTPDQAALYNAINRFNERLGR